MKAGQAMSAAAVALLAGCSSPPGAAPIANAPTATDPLGEIAWQEGGGESLPNTGLGALAAQQAADIEAFQSGAGLPNPSTTNQNDANTLPAGVVPTPRAQDDGLRALSMGSAKPTSTDQSGTDQANASTEDETETAPPVISREARIAQLSVELANLLKEEAIEASDPARPLIAAAMLESVASGVIEEIDLPGGGPLMLTEEERAALMTVRELAVRLAGQSGEIGGDPQRIREVLTRAAEDLREHARVRIGSAQLCLRAPGFGNYVPLERRTFLAGRTNRVVVYAEVEHFGLRPATLAEAMTPGDTVAAELTQELELYLRSGDSRPTWQRRIEWLPRTSRRSFRDLFLASAIELPATLSVGEYDLKIRVIDEVTGAQDESIIPIRLVADASGLEGEPSDATDPDDKTPEPGDEFSSILFGRR